MSDCTSNYLEHGTLEWNTAQLHKERCGSHLHYANDEDSGGFNTTWCCSYDPTHYASSL